MPIPTIARESAEDKATRILRSHLISGYFPVGTRLKEVELSGQLGIARTTLRVALHRLAQERLIDQVPYTGWVVVEFGVQDAWELYTLRSHLEALGARLAARSLTATARKRLEHSLARLLAAVQAQDDNTAADADFDLHKTIVDLSGHTRLKEQYALVEQQIRLLIISSDKLIMHSEELMSQHEPIVKAILAQAPDQAEMLATQHNELEQARLIDHMREQGLGDMREIRVARRASAMTE